MEPSLKRQRTEAIKDSYKVKKLELKNQIKQQYEEIQEQHKEIKEDKIIIVKLQCIINQKDNIIFKSQENLHSFCHKLGQKEEEIKNLNKQNEDFRRICQNVKQELNICSLERPITRNTKMRLKNCIDKLNTLPNRVSRVLNFSNTIPNTIPNRVSRVLNFSITMPNTIQ